MAAQYELLKELLNSGTKQDFGQEMFLAISLNHQVHSLQGTEIFAKHDIDTKLPCNFKRVSGTAAFYQFLTDP